jgi:hypothetical protein
MRQNRIGAAMALSADGYQRSSVMALAPGAPGGLDKEYRRQKSCTDDQS